MDKTCFNDIIDLLLPFMQVESTRLAICETAWYDSPLRYQVQWTGNAHTFTTLAVRKAIDFGQVEKDVPALLALLEGLRPQVGYDVQERIDEIIARCLQVKKASLDTSSLPELPPAGNSPAKQHLFISYSSADRAGFVDRLAKELTARDYQMWVDNLGPQYNGITAGKAWKQELADALNQAQALVFVVTHDSLNSIWCRAELTRATEQNTPIIPVLARPISDDDRALMAQIQVNGQMLGDVQYRDFVGLGWDRGFEVLLSDLEKHISI